MHAGTHSGLRATYRPGTGTSTAKRRVALRVTASDLAGCLHLPAAFAPFAMEPLGGRGRERIIMETYYCMVEKRDAAPRRKPSFD